MVPFLRIVSGWLTWVVNIGMVSDMPKPWSSESKWFIAFHYSLLTLLFAITLIGSTSATA